MEANHQAMTTPPPGVSEPLLMQTTMNQILSAALQNRRVEDEMGSEIREEMTHTSMAEATGVSAGCSLHIFVTYHSGAVSSLSGPGPLFYGMPLDGVQPLEPDPQEFVYYPPDLVSSVYNATLPTVLEPTTAVEPPPDYWYPRATTFDLVEDTHYMRGVIFISDFRTVDKALIRQRAMCTIDPPNIKANFDDDGLYIDVPIPGMIHMTLGVPYVQSIDGNVNHTMTVAVAHTVDSLACFGQAVHARVTVLVDQLYLFAFGSNPNHPAQPRTCSLFSLVLKHNDRSVSSFSIASTVEKGQGQGSAQPAVQVNTPEATAMISEVLSIIHELQQIILPRSLSHFEWEMIRFATNDNNIFVFGGLGAGATGLQLNVSQGTGNLTAYIGQLQGKWHTDISDAAATWTLGILLLKIPPGSDPGPFMLGRTGLYVRETGVLVLFLIFRGNDLHSGFAPSYPTGAREAWISKEEVTALFNIAAPENRCFFVSYATEVTCSRTAGLSVTPPVTFMNLGAPVPHKLHARNYAQHGEHILGGLHAHRTRLSREIVWGALNALQYAGLTLDMTAADLFSRIKYRDSLGEHHTVDPPPFDLSNSHQAEEVMRMRRLYTWFRLLCNRYQVRVTKDMYQTVQACIALKHQLGSGSHLDMERYPIHASAPSPSSVPCPYARVISVISRQVVDGQVNWTLDVQTKGGTQTHVTVVESTSPWLFDMPHSSSVLAFVSKNIPASQSLQHIREHLAADQHANPMLTTSPMLMSIPSRNTDNTTTTLNSDQETNTVVSASLVSALSALPVSDCEYEIEAIVDHRVIDGVQKWLVRWKGYPVDRDDDESWLPYENFTQVTVICLYLALTHLQP
ncbi:unnamed protein product [Mycena citricolor]|uniref:Chromo domain-containing protein n=1 Tax=Mycena citricolor TaxID=2018698 RepID=A0AAD2H5T2_9AGAR|nr:unnamed protein product [Mycena citricolor]